MDTLSSGMLGRCISAGPTLWVTCRRLVSWHSFVGCKELEASPEIIVTHSVRVQHEWMKEPPS